MTNPKIWNNRRGRRWYQPRRSDGAYLVRVCAAGSCVTVWSTDTERYGPRLYPFEWMARLRGRVGDWRKRRQELAEIHPV